MKSHLTFTVPGKPTPKARPRVTSHGTFTPKATQLAEARVLECYLHECGHGNPLTCAVRLTIDAIFEVPQSWPKYRRAAAAGASHTSRPDADNIAKLVTDALNGSLFADDSQIAHLAVSKRYARTDETARIDVRCEWEDE